MGSEDFRTYSNKLLSWPLENEPYFAGRMAVNLFLTFVPLQVWPLNYSCLPAPTWNNNQFLLQPVDLSTVHKKTEGRKAFHGVRGIVRVLKITLLLVLSGSVSETTSLNTVTSLPQDTNRQQMLFVCNIQITGKEFTEFSGLLMASQPEWGAGCLLPINRSALS